MAYEQLKLENQLCFPVYAASRLIIREYQPLLDKLKITYPQYLVLLVLWEWNELTVNDISHKLILNTNTVTPLLKRMESLGLVTRQRSNTDERKVVVKITEKAVELMHKAAPIPLQLAEKILGNELTTDQLLELKCNLTLLIEMLNKKFQD